MPNSRPEGSTPPGPARSEPLKDAPGRQHVARALRRITMAVHRYTSRASRLAGQPVSDVRAMGELVSAPTSIPSTDLARRLDLSKPAMSAMLTRLEHAGYTIRTGSTHDKRRVLVTPTRKAARDSASRFTELNDAIARTLETADPRDREGFLRVLDSMTAQLEAAAPATTSTSSDSP